MVGVAAAAYSLTRQYHRLLTKAVVDRIERSGQPRIARLIRREKHGRPVRLGQKIIKDDPGFGVAVPIPAGSPFQPSRAALTAASTRSNVWFDIGRRRMLRDAECCGLSGLCGLVW